MQGEKFRRGPWLKEEDDQLTYLSPLWGNGGLRRSGKSCRLRWLNYLRPNLKRGPINIEERIILHLHGLWGNKLSRIARMLPGGTDNEVKNYLRTHLRKKAQTLEGVSQNITVKTRDLVKTFASPQTKASKLLGHQNSDWLVLRMKPSYWIGSQSCQMIKMKLTTTMAVIASSRVSVIWRGLQRTTTYGTIQVPYGRWNKRCLLSRNVDRENLRIVNMDHVSYYALLAMHL